MSTDTSPQNDNITPGSAAQILDKYGPDLLPQHAQMLAASAISPEVTKARGYRSVQTKGELKRLGFTASQTFVPTLLVPVWGVNGAIALYHHRPDQPRMRGGKPVKYEFPSGAKMAVDVHPFIKERVRDPAIPLFITEGCKKADSVISQGLCCIALVGVWNFRGSNEYSGMTSLPDWEGIAFKDRNDRGRQVYIAYDSDVMLKPQVHKALERLSGFLKSRGAKVAYIYLPHGDGAAKQGLDDFLAAGHSVEDLMRLARSELRPMDTGTGNGEEGDAPLASGIPYQARPDGLFWLRPTQHGPTPVQLSNFSARILEEVVEDDGAETALTLEMEAQLGDRVRRFTIPAQGLSNPYWPMEQLGAAAVVYPGQTLKDHLRVAIQLLSSSGGADGVPRRTVYTHTGWHPNKSASAHGEGVGWVYQHAGGAINGSTTEPADGQPEPPDAGRAADGVRLAPSLRNYVLPAPPTGDVRVQAIRASLVELVRLAPARLMIPMVAATCLPIVGESDFSVWLVGKSGVFKSELAALLQQHYGPAMNARHLPANWSSSANALEGLAFAAKDALLVVDDFAPNGGQRAVAELQAKAERVGRAQGNHSGRQRMRADGSLRPEKPPRGLILATGEDVPSGSSLRGRMLILDVVKGDIPADRLSICQQQAARGLYAQSLAAFIAWVAPRYEDAHAEWKGRALALRHKAQVEAHARTPDMVAALAATWEFLLSCAVDAGAVTMGEATEMQQEGWQALLQAGRAQGEHQVSQEPAPRFIELIQSALAAGKAHVTDIQSRVPRPDPQAWGWREHTVGSGEAARTEWQAGGTQIGWVDLERDDLYLLPDVAHRVAQQLGEGTGAALQVSRQTVLKRLREGNYLKSFDAARQVNTVRRTLSGAVHNVAHMSATTISGEPDEPAEDDIPFGILHDTRTGGALDVGSGLSGFPAGSWEPDSAIPQNLTSAGTVGGAAAGNGRLVGSWGEEGTILPGHNAYEAADADADADTGNRAAATMGIRCIVAHDGVCTKCSEPCAPARAHTGSGGEWVASSHNSAGGGGNV